MIYIIIIKLLVLLLLFLLLLLLLLLFNFHKFISNNNFLIKKLKKLDAQTNRNTRLHHLLIMPIQRIPRYNMLLSEIIKYTDPSHPDYNNLNLALKNMKGVADHINESVRVSERDRKIEMLHDRMEIIVFIFIIYYYSICKFNYYLI